MTSYGPSRLSIPTGGTRTLVVHLAVTDCAAVGTDAAPTLALNLDRWWGTATVHVQPPPGARPSGC